MRSEAEGAATVLPTIALRSGKYMQSRKQAAYLGIVRALRELLQSFSLRIAYMSDPIRRNALIASSSILRAACNSCNTSSAVSLRRLVLPSK